MELSCLVSYDASAMAVGVEEVKLGSISFLDFTISFSSYNRSAEEASVP